MILHKTPICGIIGFRMRWSDGRAGMTSKGRRIMDMTDIVTHARAMYDRAGPRAIAIAAQKTRDCEAAGKRAEAEDWRRIRACLMERAGPRAT